LLKFRTLVLASASLLSVATPALAQQNAATADTADEAEDSGDIVVTGTLIRGIAPGGSQTIAVDQSKIAAIGAVNTSDLLAAVPQAGNFLAYASIRGTNGVNITVNRPSLRYLGNTSSSSASTLVLVDGHRLPGMGVRQSTMDIDAISPNAVERVDVITDGGSATYGSDAIGGVINFITRRRFDGVEVKGSYGFADDVSQYNAGIIAGKTIGDVSAYVAYDFAKHDDLLGLDRDYAQGRDWINNVPGDIACPVGNVRGATTTTYSLPGLSAGLGNRCDNTEFQSLYPEEEKHSVFGSVQVDSGGPVTFGVKAYYVHRKVHSTFGPPTLANGVSVPSTSTYFIALPGAPTTETFFFNLSSLYGNSPPSVSSLESYGFTPEMKWNMGGGWQLNAMFNFGVGDAKLLTQNLNAAEISSAARDGKFDPVNLANPINLPALAKARDWFSFGRAKHELVNTRAIIDGPLFELPAGKVRVAIGAEFMREKFTGFSSPASAFTAAGIAAIVDNHRSRDVTSVFGELNVPVFGAGSGIGDLSVNLSGRYDHYSDFGSTFNPKIGANFAPVEWLKLRGNWGTAFQAAGISLLADPLPSFATVSHNQRPNPKIGLPIGSRTNVLAFNGPKFPLNPQEATTWSLGFDIKPPVLEGFSAGLTYYSVNVKNVIAAPSAVGSRLYLDYLDRVVTYDQGEGALKAFYDALTAQGSIGAAQTIAALPNGDFSSVYSVIDVRSTNLGRVITTGLDFYARMRKETGFGDVFADVSGNYVLSFKQQASAAAPVISTVELETTRLRLQTTLGANIGNLRAQAIWNHSQGFAITPTATNAQQSRVDSFNVINLFFQYKVPGESSIAKDLTFTLNVDNLFDQDPPLYRGQISTFSGFANGFTLGRMIRLGVSKKF
jgi:iron complex outermembrane receptor protein